MSRQKVSKDKTLNWEKIKEYKTNCAKGMGCGAKENVKRSKVSRKRDTKRCEC